MGKFARCVRISPEEIGGGLMNLSEFVCPRDLTVVNHLVAALVKLFG